MRKEEVDSEHESKSNKTKAKTNDQTTVSTLMSDSNERKGFKYYKHGVNIQQTLVRLEMKLKTLH